MEGASIKKTMHAQLSTLLSEEIYIARRGAACPARRARGARGPPAAPPRPTDGRAAGATRGSDGVRAGRSAEAAAVWAFNLRASPRERAVLSLFADGHGGARACPRTLYPYKA